MTKPREFWLEPSNMCAWNMDEKPAPHRACIHVREITNDEIRVSREDWESVIKTLELSENDGDTAYAVDKMRCIEREQESK